MVLVTPCICIMFLFSGQSAITKMRKRFDSDAEMNVTKACFPIFELGEFYGLPSPGASGEHAMSLISIPPQPLRVFLFNTINVLSLYFTCV